MKKQPSPSEMILTFEHAFRLVLFVTCIFTKSILSGQTDTIDPCGKALIQQVDYDALDTQAAYAYLSQIDEDTWNSKKSDAGFVGKWTGFLGPMSGDLSYDQFNQARTHFFEGIHYNGSSATTITKLRRYVTKDQLDAWEKCNEDRGRYGLFVTEVAVSDDNATFELRWTAPPPGGATEVPITNSRVSGGHSLESGAPKGRIYQDGERIKYGSKTFVIAREPSKGLTVTVDAGGYSVTDVISRPTPTPSPTSTPSITPPPNKSFQVLGVRHRDKSIGKYFGFKAEDLDEILGREDWGARPNGTLISISPSVNGPFRQARVWKFSNGTAGTAHGRYEEGWRQGDWHEGEIVYVQPVGR